ncbi:Transposase IS200 like protein [Caloramator mitchellensis]|uniref:Transposase IS200 like protein n=1 Tax=Caloramator mitchellensis TaxID=908809 RepID=A0A0R3K421_CALMK|nr:transposase [Caloramator mitchellensis]KRQ87829.1 Transposase IS200 like protein [Caloramator mitchellensis]
MSRLPRIIYKNAIYHVYQRGNNKEEIFKNPKHKAVFLKQIKDYRQVFDYELLAYAIMDNHYHLMIKAGESSISQVMFNINNSFCKYLNENEDRVGHVFAGRFNAKVVEDEVYLFTLLRYIHRNPVKAGLCDDVNKYKWSSHVFYKYAINNNFINTREILQYASPDLKESIRFYNNIVGFDSENDFEKDYETIKSTFFPDQDEAAVLPEILIEKKIFRKSLEEIFNELFSSEDVKKFIMAGSKSPRLTKYKVEFIKKALNYKYTLKEIGDFLKISESAVCRLINKSLN